MTMNRGVIALMAATFFLGGCVSVPEQLKGDYPTLTPGGTGSADIGRTVRWGGVILETRPDERQTCFEILSRTLDRSLRPEDEDITQGRFIACRDGFLDPEIFSKGREITLTGDVTTLDQRKVGEYDYQYPVLATRFITLWPERPDVIIRNYYDPWYDPWYWGPYSYGFRYRGYYGAHPYPRTSVTTGKSTERVDIPEDQLE